MDKQPPICFHGGMKTSTYKLTAIEQEVLDGVTVRLINASERKRFDALIIKEHYLHSADLVGEQLRYVAEYQGQWLALQTWNAAAFHLKGRDEWIGWTDAQRRQRLNLVANNSRYLVLEGSHYPNLASRVMKLCLGRLSSDWASKYGHPILVVESFVDSQLFRGTSYKVSGWTLLGQTKGWCRARQDFYQKHERPKQLWVRELRKDACQMLRRAVLPPEYGRTELARQACCTQSVEELSAMEQHFGQIPDFRGREGYYSLSGLIAIIACATLCGAMLGPRDLEAFAATLSPKQLAALKFKKWGRPRRRQQPKETTFFRVLSMTDPGNLERALLGWQERVLGKRPRDDTLVAIDGKENRSSQGTELVNAYAVKSGRWLGSERVPEGTNEITAARTLIARIDLTKQTAILDALHTNADTARQIVQEKGGDYVLTVKGNQKTLRRTLSKLQAPCLRSFSPSAHGGGPRGCGGIEQRPCGSAPFVALWCDAGTSGFSGGCPSGTRAAGVGSPG